MASYKGTVTSSPKVVAILACLLAKSGLEDLLAIYFFLDRSNSDETVDNDVSLLPQAIGSGLRSIGNFHVKLYLAKRTTACSSPLGFHPRSYSTTRSAPVTVIRERHRPSCAVQRPKLTGQIDADTAALCGEQACKDGRVAIKAINALLAIRYFAHRTVDSNPLVTLKLWRITEF